jgi:hypothetical protein
MSLPTTFFLDTSVLAGQQYNFASAALTSFVPVARQRSLRLLLPDPTKREILRHIRARSVEALRALEDARRRAPFLAKWRHFPKLPESRYGDWEVQRIAVAEWEAFLKQFVVVQLGYEDVRLETVMGWYDAASAPFKEGKKRKEFPDALAIATLAGFAARTKVYVAVVSDDPDFKTACDRFPYLLHFSSLPKLTELPLSEDQAIQVIRDAVLGDQGLLEEAIFAEADSLSAYHYDSRFKDIDQLDLDSAEADEIHVVGVGGRDCTVTFEGYIYFYVRLRWVEHDLYDGEPHERSERVRDHARISGTAKLRLKDDRSGVEEVTFIELDQAEVEVTEEP